MMRIRTLFFLVIFSVTGLLCGFAFFFMTNRWLDLSALEQSTPGRPSILLDDEGVEWARFQLDKREPIALSELPDHVVKAFLAAEDHQFFVHHGISVRGVLRSLITNIRHLRYVQGASTITQQLVRVFFVSNERTIWRKVREQLLSILIEQQFSKEQILEAYLNHVYFGAGIYGIQAAAQRFWKVSVRNLTVGQAALLAGILPSPQRYSPLYCERLALERRNIVLKCMLSCGFISQKVCDESSKGPVGLKRDSKEAIAPYLREMIRRQLEEKFGRNTLYTGGLIVQTTLNRKAQLEAEHTFKRHIERLRSVEPKLDGALVCLDNGTAAIKALIGGYDYGVSQFNRVTQAVRQMGSMFKPVVYAVALEQGKEFSDTAVDEPLVAIGNWAPQNVTREFEGTVTLAHALSLSNNIIPVKLLLEMGVEKIIACARRLQLPGPFMPYPSLALGCTECSPLQAAALFNLFANRGVYTEPYFIEWVKNEGGQKELKHYPRSEQVLSWAVSSELLQALRIVGDHLRDRMPDRWIQGDVAGKTGTTNDNRTCWFAGVTPTHTSVVCLGRDDNKSMEHKIFSMWHALPIWLDFNGHIEDPSKAFYFDPQLKRIRVNRYSGCPASESDVNSITLLSARV
ncbi:TPA: hypothetical protein DDZ86_02625 [Candidatus Dependentiae bacterium]|nr:MAG: Membrane carboxypeptidase [candidate division TM6 bacterium GW2011_GWF2_43_87]HBL98513.1 hypothetical protein [Candidatus Dependentiae bacterium]